jgi:hypothetical protein
MKIYVDCKDVSAFLESISYKVVDVVSTETSDTCYTDCQKLMMIQDRFFKFMAKHGKDYTNVLMFYSESTNNVVIRLSINVDENRLQQAILEYNQKRNEIDSLLTIEVIKHVQALGKKFPQIQSFVMAMGLISFELEYDMRIEDGEENDDTIESYMITRDVSLYSYMGNFYDDEKYVLELFGIDKDLNFIALKDIIDAYAEDFKMSGEGLRMDREDNFIPNYNW